MGGKNNYSTGNLYRHLRTEHESIFPERRNENEKFVSVNEKKNMSIVFNILFIFKVFSQSRYRSALLKWIVNSNQPFTEIEQDSFLELISTLNPFAETISDSTLKRDLVKKYDDMAVEIKEYIKQR